MSAKALFIGSIGVVTETSEYQRKAYNQAMSENGLDWQWTPAIYKDLLKSNGGKNRLHLLSQATQQPLQEEIIDKIHARKTALATQMVVADQLSPRAGLVKLVKEAKQAGAIVAWVTSTYEENTNALLEASQDQLSESDFDYIFHRTDATAGKPSPSIYQAALKHFDLHASNCIAIEDSLISLLAAKAAGIFTVASLGAYHDESVENIADLVVSGLDETNWSKLVEQFEKVQAPSLVA
ncbi:MAG: HAD-IA family hydrolase [Bacteroidota bacterium]